MSVNAALLDTDVFSLLFVRHGGKDPRIAGWRELLTGRQVVISFQTRAELMAGALLSEWGDRRLEGLGEILDRTPTIGIDGEVIGAYAELVALCRRMGHPLQQKLHTGDRWIAACAIAKRLDLLAGDAVYRDAPGVSLLAA